MNLDEQKLMYCVLLKMLNYESRVLFLSNI